MAAGDLDISVSTVMGLETIVKRELEVISILQRTFLPFLPRLLCASSLLRKVLISQALGYRGATASNGRVDFKAGPEALARCASPRNTGTAERGDGPNAKVDDCCMG